MYLPNQAFLFGEYTLREETAPYGYKIANDVKFKVEDTGKVQKVSMKDGKDHYNPWLYAGIGAAAHALGLFSFFKKRKEDEAEA